MAAEGPVTAVQEALKREQFFFGAPTGVLDEPTHAALRRFQIRRGLPVTGEIDTATVQALQSPADQPAKPAAPREAPQPEPPKKIVEGDREFLKQVESGQPAAPDRETPEPPVLPPSPAPAASAAPPERLGTTEPSLPARTGSVQRKPAVARSRPAEKPRESTMHRIERALVAEGDAAPPSRNPGLDSIAEPPPRRPETRLAPSAARTDEREGDPDITASPGAKITRSTTTATGPDGRTYIYEKKTTTYAGTPFPVGRNAASKGGGGFFERLFRDKD
ncbi:MAG: putative peptidoglycan binding domain [Chthoniobacter sp.]|jgi:hypothetical protein|nr:putative peptidoglycan binding domain [Chthoniobacter sp.]